MIIVLYRQKEDPHLMLLRFPHSPVQNKPSAQLCLNEVVLCIRSTLCHEAASKARSLHTDPQIHVPFGAELFLPPSRLHLPSLFKSVSLLLPSSYWNWPMFFLFASSQTWSGVLWYLGFVSILSKLYPMGAQEISSICHYLLLLLWLQDFTWSLSICFSFLCIHIGYYEG